MSLSSARVGRIATRYALAIDRDAVLSSLAEPYEMLVRECMQDDRITGTSEDALARAGYPPLETLLGMPELLRLVLGSYLEEELLTAVLPPASGAMDGTWAIDTIEEVHLVGDRVLLEGTCYAF